MDGYSIYVHLPFCATKCRYCDFGSVATADIPFSRYSAAVLEELARRRPAFAAMRLVSVYLGGGTPSLWPARELSRLVAACEVREGIEVTVEANPGDADRGWFEELVDAGATRFSIGVQAMDDDRLAWMGRRHDTRAAAAAIACANESRVKSVSADIIYGTPGHTAAGLSSELDRLCDLGVAHVSAYELTVARGTPIGELAAANALTLPGDEEVVELWDAAAAALLARGLRRYEVSSHAAPGHESAHNRHYWRGGVYLGVGAGAHGCRLEGGELLRWRNTRDPEAYISGAPAEIERVGAVDRARELVMLGMRCVDGIAPEAVLALPPAEVSRRWREVFARLVDAGYATSVGDRLVPTGTGMLTADGIAELFF